VSAAICGAADPRQVAAALAEPLRRIAATA
jgi:hypothetical protein